jgi:hypothetical protein
VSKLIVSRTVLLPTLQVLALGANGTGLTQIMEFNPSRRSVLISLNSSSDATVTIILSYNPALNLLITTGDLLTSCEGFALIPTVQGSTSADLFVNCEFRMSRELYGDMLDGPLYAFKPSDLPGPNYILTVIEDIDINSQAKKVKLVRKGLPQKLKQSTCEQLTKLMSILRGGK